MFMRLSLTVYIIKILIFIFYHLASIKLPSTTEKNEVIKRKNTKQRWMIAGGGRTQMNSSSFWSLNSWPVSHVDGDWMTWWISAISSDSFKTDSSFFRTPHLSSPFSKPTRAYGPLRSEQLSDQFIFLQR